MKRKIMKKETESSSPRDEGTGREKGRDRTSMTRQESEDMRDLFLHELKDIYWAEKTLAKELPGMAEKVSSQELREAILLHKNETNDHVKRLEEVFALLGEDPEEEKCEGMKGLLDEAKEVADEFPEGRVRDAAIIASAQKVEHYEICAYGTLISLATYMGEEKVVKPLKDTLLEEWAADEKLSMLGQSIIHPAKP
jgi:ferritin-like metal-binding protein YciE